MLTVKGNRPKTKGGIFLTLARKSMTPRERAIYAGKDGGEVSASAVDAG